MSRCAGPCRKNMAARQRSTSETPPGAAGQAARMRGHALAGPDGHRTGRAGPEKPPVNRHAGWLGQEDAYARSLSQHGHPAQAPMLGRGGAYRAFRVGPPRVRDRPRHPAASHRGFRTDAATLSPTGRRPEHGRSRRVRVRAGHGHKLYLWPIDAPLVPHDNQMNHPEIDARFAARGRIGTTRRQGHG